MEHPVIAWWSGGVTSAVTCKLCIDKYGKENVRIIYINTKNEDTDTYRFLQDCEKWYGLSIEWLTNEKYSCIEDVWRRFLSLNVAHGAICSSELKREVRVKFGRENKYSYQAFGFDEKEFKRSKGMSLNYPETNPIYPLQENGISKQDCITILNDASIKIPITYGLGYLNNNCFRTGCIQGGIGYWQKIQTDDPIKFNKMGLIEHELTNLKGKPVTMLKDQSKKTPGLVFLLPHPDYPNIKDISMMRGRSVKPLNDCNGFCGINDLDDRPETEIEINYEVN